MADIIFKYFPELTSNQKKRFDSLLPLYSEWNEKINLISRKDQHHLYLKHVLHSLSIAKFYTFQEGTTALDIGTGGGFPGIPLAILFPMTNFLLVDSIQKKINVVNDVIDVLGLKNAIARCERVESLDQKFDYITGRAVKNIPLVLSWTRKLLDTKSEAKNTGIIYLKGGDFDGELKLVKMKYHISAISTVFEEEFFESKKVIRFCQ